MTPDDYRLSRATGALLRFEPGYKDVMLVMGPDGPEERAVAEIGGGRVRVHQAFSIGVGAEGAAAPDGRAGAAVGPGS